MSATSKASPLLYRLADAWQTLRGRRARAVPTLDTRSIAAAETTRLLADWLATRMSRDDETRWTLATLRARARDLENNDPTTKHFLRMLTTNVIGANGFRLQSQVRNNNARLNKAFNDKLEEAWRDWSRRPTRDGKQTLTSFSGTLLRAVARDGEVFVRMHRAFTRNRFGFALEAFDPALIDETLNRAAGDGKNEIRLGVEVDFDGRPVAYHGWNREPQATANRDRERVSYPADEILHLYDPERVGQTRGVTWMLSVMVSTKMLSGYVESELIAARVAAAKMGFFQKKAGAEGAAIPNDASFTMEANPGTFGVLPEGYEVAAFSPDHPSTAFGDFVKASKREIATGHGVSYNALANDLEGVNYSSMRAGLIIERDVWRTVQEWWKSTFLEPVYEEFLNMALLHSAVLLDSRDVRKFAKYRFIGRGWPWVDPLKDTQAGIAGIAAGMASRTSLLAEQGEDFETILEELAEEQALADEYGVSIEALAKTASTPDNTDGEDDGDGADAEDAADEAVDAKAETNGSGKNGSSASPTSLRAELVRALKGVSSKRLDPVSVASGGSTVEVHVHNDVKGVAATRTVAFTRDANGDLKAATVREGGD